MSAVTVSQTATEQKRKGRAQAMVLTVTNLKVQTRI